MLRESELRRALHTSVEDLDGSAVNAALRQVRTRGHRALVRRRALLATTIVAGVALALGVAGQQLGGDVPRDDQSHITDRPASPTAQTGPLEGTWRTGTLTRQDLRSALAQGGLQGHLAAIESTWAGAVGGEIRITIHDDRVVAVLHQGGSAQTVDDERLELTSDGLVLRPAIPGWATTYRWEVNGDNLSLTFVRTTEGDTDHVPGEAWQRVLYTSATFTRA